MLKFSQDKVHWEYNLSKYF